MHQVIHVEIYVPDTKRLDALCEQFQHILRYSYNRCKKGDISGSTRTFCEDKFTGHLNKRWIRDAVLSGEGIHTRFEDQKVIFGSRESWNRLKSGLLSKEDWQSLRNHHCFARGEANNQGNLNCRIEGNYLRVNFGKRDYQSYPLHISTKQTKKMKKQGKLSDRGRLDLLLLLADQKKVFYNIRLRKKDAHHYLVSVEYELTEPETTITFKNGVIGVDTNVDHLAIAETDANGNLLKTDALYAPRMQFAKKDKRFYDIACLVNQIIDYARKTGKGIVFENLKFRPDYSLNKKRNRMFSNFCYRKILELLEAKCIQYGIAYKKVNPAFTSIIGRYKYAKMHRITGHQAAAYVIARRGLGFQEKISLFKENKESVKTRLARTLEGKYGKKRFSNWSLWSALKREQVVLTGPQSRLQTSIEPCGSRSSTTLGWEKSQTNPSLEQVRKVTDGNISSEGRKTLIQLPQ